MVYTRSMLPEFIRHAKAIYPGCNGLRASCRLELNAGGFVVCAKAMGVMDGGTEG
jgi:hypothetical protein